MKSIGVSEFKVLGPREFKKSEGKKEERKYDERILKKKRENVKMRCISVFSIGISVFSIGNFFSIVSTKMITQITLTVGEDEGV